MVAISIERKNHFVRNMLRFLFMTKLFPSVKPCNRCILFQACICESGLMSVWIIIFFYRTWYQRYDTIGSRRGIPWSRRTIMIRGFRQVTISLPDKQNKRRSLWKKNTGIPPPLWEENGGVNWLSLWDDGFILNWHGGSPPPSVGSRSSSGSWCLLEAEPCSRLKKKLNIQSCSCRFLYKLLSSRKREQTSSWFHISRWMHGDSHSSACERVWAPLLCCLLTESWDLHEVLA